MDWFWSFFWWWFGLVGIGGVILTFMFWPLLAGTKIGRMLLAIGAAVLGALAMLARARQQGADAERKRQEKRNADWIEKQKHRDADIAGSTDAALDDRLRDRSRNPGAGP
jgi:type VI protein secretion system component VasK